MNEKLSFQHVADVLAQKTGVSKKVADIFTKAFFDTVVDAFYMGEESVKVKGLGTFKLVEVESRESVNVSNGERIVIPGYKKVSFVPEDGVVEFLNPEATQSVAEKDSVPEVAPAVKETPIVETPAEIETPVEEKALMEKETPAQAETPLVEDEPVGDDMETLIQVPEPARVEEPQDAFSGIDMLISTPESMEEVRQQYEEAKAKMETAVAEARKANAEKVRLEKLLARLEANAVPETPEEVAAEPVVPEEVPVAEEVMAETPSEKIPEQDEYHSEPIAAEEDKHQEAFHRLMNDAPRTEEVAAKPKKNHAVAWVLTIVLVLLAVICFFLYQTFLSIEAVETVPKTEKKEQVKKKDTQHQAKKPVQPAQAETAKQDETKAVDKMPAQKEEVKPVKPTKPATHVLQRGESLTRISQKYYSTKDSVRAIIRENEFSDPDNLPVGTVVKLP